MRSQATSRKPPQRPFVKKYRTLLKLKRLQLEKEHIDWHKKKWRNILWTDESQIVIFGFKGHRPLTQHNVL
uniref:Transposase Tc1-like domain-containing protein n=1 Tax=Poecilia latipinna TaxID=48699 RepID=A0A3B3UMM1_9TELE